MSGLNGTPMSPAERKIWAASHNLSAEYMLVTSTEMMVMANAMNQQTAINRTLEQSVSDIALAVEGYNDTEPDLENMVRAAAFDAEKYGKAVKLVLPKLRKMRDSLLKPTEFGVASALTESIEIIKDLDKAIAKRRDRSAAKS